MEVSQSYLPEKMAEIKDDSSDSSDSCPQIAPVYLKDDMEYTTPVVLSPPTSPAESSCSQQEIEYVFVSNAILEDCAQRDSRCAHALRVRSLDEIRFPQHESGHTFATVLGAHCTACTNWRACNHAKSKFNSTHNSKRRVHTLLFWKHMLGVHFPIPDSLLQDAVWKNLDSCACGIKRSNGHAKQAGKVCINPNHYKPVDYNTILDALIDAVTAMGIFPQHQRIVAVICLRPAFANPELTFNMLCECLRRTVPTSNPLLRA